MDHESFDRIVRLLGTPGSRRTALAALLGAGVFGAVETALGKKRTKSRSKGKDKNNQRGKDRKAHGRKQKRANRIQAEAVCFGGSPCIPGPGKNLGKCDFGGSTTLKDKNLKGANLGGANLAKADASGANFASANLGACLVDANLTGATINNSTNVGSAVICRTTMPDGSVSNASCNKGTPCCPTCDVANPCPVGEVCCKGRCRNGDCCVNADCPSTVCCANTCCDASQVCNTNQNPDTCCAPAGSCPAGFCGSVPDGCGGQIQCPCGGNLTCCGETCVDTATDRNHCGGCGDRCAAWQTACQAGECTPTCASQCPANCNNCFGLQSGGVACGSFGVAACDPFGCVPNAQCGPGGGVCTVTVTSRATNETTPLCDFDFVAVCTSIAACA